MTRRFPPGLAALAAWGWLAAIACTFPAIGFKGDTSSGGSGGATTSASSSPSSASAATSGGGATATAASSTEAASSGAASSSSGEPPCGDAGSCDCDGDGDKAKSCGGGDCNDHDPLVRSTQTAWFTDAGSNGWDYNCNGKDDYEITTVLNCTNGLECDTTTVGWHGSVPDCGVMGQYGTCKIPAALQCAENITGSQRQGCH
jgi:hypothetical protein